MNNTESAGFILHPAWILHPILHPKYPINKGTFKDWCRNVGEKHKTFFGESRLRKCKTPDFFEANLRTFEAKHRNFTSKKSDVFGVRTGHGHLLCWNPSSELLAKNIQLKNVRKPFNCGIWHIRACQHDHIWTTADALPFSLSVTEQFEQRH